MRPVYFIRFLAEVQLLRLHLIALPLLLLLPSQQQPGFKPFKAQNAAAASNKSPEDSPVLVKVLPAERSEAQAAQDAKEREEKAANDRNLVRLTGILAAVGFLQLLVFGYQAYKLRQTVESAGEQSRAMERHIGEVSRSALAMENISKVIDSGNRSVMRAYLSVEIGNAIYQERYRTGKQDLRFEARPRLVNNGNTPARNVSIRIQAEILTLPVARDFDFAITADPINAAGIVAPRQGYEMSAVVNDFVPDAEVESIKQADGRALHVWGMVNYDDIFGDTHFTKFNQSLMWLPNGTVFGYHTAGHNDAN